MGEGIAVSGASLDSCTNLYVDGKALAPIGVE
jgi:hypothetical protein